ncbi:MFS family permease [Arthrobacter globiformis]|nr:MFS family permease [Arthrobacter globiformis]
MDFRLDAANCVIAAFHIASAPGQPLMGRLADRFGPRRPFMLGMALVAVSCALTPFSPNFVFVCSRHWRRRRRTRADIEANLAAVDRFAATAAGDGARWWPGVRRV